MSEPVDTSTAPVGRITGCYGIKGWVKVHPYTQTHEGFAELGQWQARRRGQLEPVDFDQFKRHGKGLIAHIAGVDDRTAAEAYAGLELEASLTVLPALEPGEYYWHQLQGLQVWCTEGAQRDLLGVVDYLIETGANDVLVIRPCEGSNSDQERLVPYLPGDTVTEVDLDAGRIEIDWFLHEE